MEIIGLLIIYWLGYTLLKSIFAAGKSAVTGDSFKESLKGIPDFGFRVSKERMEEDPSKHFYSIEIKGPIPIRSACNLGALVTIFDVTEGEEQKSFVISHIDFLQEDVSTIFRSYQEVGQISEGDGFTKWVRLGAVFPELIQTAYSGRRKIRFNLFLVDANSPPSTEYGFLVSSDGVFWGDYIEEEILFNESGYMEEAENRDEARRLTVQIGVAVAMSDGSLDDAEGEIIKTWITKTISAFKGEKRADLKKAYNKAFKEAFLLAQKGELDLQEIIGELNTIGSEKLKFDAYELANEVMAADGDADPNELKAVREIGEGLELDTQELEQIRSRYLLNVGDALEHDNSLEELLGIDPSWEQEEVRKHLAKEYQRWNGRLNSLDNPEEKQNAQLILQRIGEARSKYDIS